MVRQTELFVNPNNQKFENMKNALRGINFLHLCTINDDHIIFCPFNPPPLFSCPWQPGKSKFWKMKKNAWTYNFPWWLGHLEILSFYTFAPIWCMVHGSHMMYGSWDMEHKRQCFVILDCFLPFSPITPPPPNVPRKNFFDKMKKKPEDIIILQMCTINDNHMMYGSWYKECNGHNFLSFWTVFWSFTSLWPEKIKILKKWKNAWRHHFTQMYQKSYATLLLWYYAWQM